SRNCSRQFVFKSSNAYSNCRGGFRKDLGHYVRSEWEAKVCRFLKSSDKAYVYEGVSFPVAVNGKVHFYTPDLEVNGKFFEIKGHAKGESAWVCKCKVCVKQREVYECFKAQ